MKHLLSCFLIFLHTLANARVFVPVEEVTAAKAGVQAVASATVVGTVNHQGNFGKALEDLGKPDRLRSIAASIVTAGLVENVTQTLKLPDAPKTFGEHFQKAAIKGAVSLPVNATLGGMEPDKAFGEAALSIAANTLGGFAATKIGKAYGAEKLSYAEHKALHGVVGAATGAIIHPKNPGKGALAGALGAVTSEMLAEAISGNPKEMATRVLGEVAERAAKEGRRFSKQEYDAALQQAGVEIMVAVVGGTAIKQGFKIAGKFYPTAKAAWFAYVAENPIMAKIGDAVASAVERGKGWVGMGMGRAVELKKPTLNLELSFKKGMNKRDFDRKIAALQKAAQDGRLRTVKETPNRRGVTHQYRKRMEKTINKIYKNNEISKKRILEKLKNNMDIDHIIDLQLGGGNTSGNLKAIDRMVNRSLGSQIQKQLPKAEGVEIRNILVRIDK